MESRRGENAAPVDSAALERKARFGMIALGARGVLMQLTVLGGDVYLRRRLEPSDFGTYAIVQFTLALFMQFGDVGIAGALIQQQDAPSKRQLSSAWSLQMLISLAMTSALWAGAPLLARFWPDATHGVWIFRALSIDLLLTSMRLVPSLLMERNLEYGKLSLLDVILNLTYYAAAIVMASLGWGAMALVGAVLVQGFFGVVGAYALRPWAPSLVIDAKLLRPIVHFGVRFQMKSVIGFLSAAVAPVYAGRVLGQRQLGFINWGQSTAYFPLKLVEIMSRVSFPLYSRLQTDRVAFARALERAVAISAMGTLFFVGLGLGLGPRLVSVVYGAKWLPAVPLFYVYALGISVGFLHPVVGPALDALGKPQVNVKLMIGWTVAICALVAVTTPRWGALGFAIGYCIPMVLGNVVVVFILKQLVPNVGLWPRTRALILGSVAVGLAGRFLIEPWIQGVVTLVLGVLASVVLFVAIIGLLNRSAIEDVLALIGRKS